MRLPIFVLLLALCAPLRAPAQTQPFLTTSGNAYPMLNAGPLRLATGKMGFRFVYVTTLKLTDVAGLRKEAEDIAYTLLLKEPKLTEMFPEGLVVGAMDAPPVAIGVSKSSGWNTVLGPKDMQPLLQQLARRPKTLTLVKSGWARHPWGPIETITEAKRGETYFLLGLVDGFTRNPAGEGQLMLDGTATGPDGKPMQVHNPFRVPASVPIAAPTANVGFEASDPPGTYSLEYSVTDTLSGTVVKVSKATLLLK